MKEHFLRISIALLLSGLTLAATQNPQPATQKATIEGTVTRSGTGQPLKGARVTLRPGNTQEQQTMVLRMAAAEAGKFVTTAGGGATATTDDNGRFAFTGVDPGVYRISAERDGFIRGEYGQRTSTGSGSSVTVSPNQRLMVDLRMLQAGAISGRVLNPDGEPASESSVHAYTYQYANGQRTLAQVASAQTNDLGEYRLFGLQPGEYFVGLISNQAPDDAPSVVDVSQTPSGKVPGDFTGLAVAGMKLAMAGFGGNPPVYYPGTIDPDAAASVTLAAASELRGVDFNLRPTRTATLSGRVVAPFSLSPSTVQNNVAVAMRSQGTAGGSFQQFRFAAAPVRLTRIGSGNSELSGLTTAGLTSTAGSTDGDFEIKGVPPGSYQLTATARDPDGQQFTGRTRVDIGTTDMGNAVVTLRAGVVVRGRIGLDAAPPPGFKMSQLRVSLVAEDVASGAGKVFFSGGAGEMIHVGTNFSLGGQSAAGEVGEDGSFSIQDVGTMEYRVRVTGLLAGAYLMSGRIGSNDALNAPFSLDSEPPMLQLQVGFSSGRVSGTVTDAKGSPAPGTQAVLVPDQARRGRSDAYFNASAGQDGQFAINNVPPGSYKVFAWEDIPDGAYQYPDFIRRYEDRGQLVTVGANGSVNADVRLIPAN